MELKEAAGNRWRTDDGRVWITRTPAELWQVVVDDIDLGPFEDLMSAAKAARLMLDTAPDRRR